MTNTDKEDAVILEPPNPQWLEQAQQEIALLKQHMPFPWVVDIQHFGSTAIPHLRAKPIIDIMIGVHSIQQAQALVPIIKRLGYIFWDENPKKDRLFFVKGMPPFGKKRTHHIHVFEVSSYEWFARRAFRDYLKTHPDTRLAYEHLKTHLAKDFHEDREAYTEAKTKFVQDTVAQAAKPLLRFAPLSSQHFPLLHQWLETPHVRSWWDQDVQWTSNKIREKFEPYTKGYKLEHGTQTQPQAYIIQLENLDIGYIQLYNAYDFPREDGILLDGLPSSLAAIDLFIGNADFVGKGLGIKIIQKFLGAHVWPRFDACFVDPDTANQGAILAYEKAGFKKVKTAQDGKVVWMLCEKPA